MSYCESAFPFRFFDTKKAVNCVKREKVFIIQSFYIFPIILCNMGKRLSIIYNLIPAFKWNLEPSIFFNFSFLRRTSDNFRLLRNLTMVRSLLILWQFKIFWAVRNICFVQNVTDDRLEIFIINWRCDAKNFKTSSSTILLLGM